MSEDKKIRLICEGDMDCCNPVYLTKKEVIEHNENHKVITCRDCKPMYGNDIREMPFPMEKLNDAD